MDKTSFGFPFKIASDGKIMSKRGNENIRAKIMQILFTSPGERVMNPEFGCGLLDLVFEPNNDILAATTEFNIRNALQRWMGDEISVDYVNVESDEEKLQIEIIYVRKDNLEKVEMKVKL
jgi:phage baseplate assembly protein W